jgi:5-methylcytosine-specific restriction protein A
MCLKLNITTPADTVDHIEPHQGGEDLFWSMDNLQALCASHHSGLKRSMEKGGPGHDTACGLDGNPIDEKHPWNK